MPLYHPVALAEELATLDIMTRGRLVVGVGAGYRADEFTAFGMDFAQRFAMLDESVALMKRLWTEDHRHASPAGSGRWRTPGRTSSRGSSRTRRCGSARWARTACAARRGWATAGR